jgi:thiamine pyrophosphate-dependent acetolactate synthase large subunit-like protein
VVVMKNNTLGQIKWEQLMFLGNPEYECDLQPIDFARVAEGMGFAAYRVDTAENCRAVLEEALSREGPVLVEATVNPNEPLLPPKRMPKYVENLEKALNAGTPAAEEIRAVLHRQPYARQLEP